jgi:hypothetical protein
MTARFPAIKKNGLQRQSRNQIFTAETQRNNIKETFSALCLL